MSAKLAVAAGGLLAVALFASRLHRDHEAAAPRPSPRSAGKDPLEGSVKCPDLPRDRDDVALSGPSALAYCRGGMESVYFAWEIRIGETNVLYLPNQKLWRETKPDWAADRRDEIVARVLAITSARGRKFAVIEY
jgi:hypothetical protein